MNLSIGKISLIVTSVTIAAICILAVFVMRQSKEVKNLYAKSKHAQNIMVQVNAVENIIARYKDLRKIYVLTGDNKLPPVLDSLARSSEISENHLSTLTLNNSEQKAPLDSLINYLDAFNAAALQQRRSNFVQNEIQMAILADSIYSISKTIQASARESFQMVESENEIKAFRFGSLLYLFLGLGIILVALLVHQSITYLRTEKKVETEKTANNLLVEQFEDGVICTDDNLTITRWNRKAEKLFGWSAEEMKGQHLASALKVDLSKGEGANVVKEMMGEGIWEGNLTVSQKGGDKVTLHACCMMLWKGEKKVAGVIIMIKELPAAAPFDTTTNDSHVLGKMIEDRTSEISLVLERLVASEKKYKLLFDYSPLPMWMISLPEGKITEVNDAAIKLFGSTRKSFLQLNASSLVVPDEAEAFKRYLEHGTSGYNEMGTWRQPAKDGGVLHSELFTYHIKLQGVPMCLVLSNDITQKLQAEEKIKQSFEAIRLLTAHLQNVREDERRNISRDIHDELGQHLTVIKMDVAWLNKKLKDPDAETTERLKKMLETTDVTIKFVRRLCSELRPVLLDDMGLVAALEWQSEKFRNITGIALTLNKPAENIQVCEESKTALFRIFQEALTNIARYAQANHVNTSLTVNEIGNVSLTITDNGIGFDPAIMRNNESLGIIGMRERCMILGGNFEITSYPGNGTSIRATVPADKTQFDEIVFAKEINNYKITSQINL